jgi:very-short-patch-repair endonuclease
MVIHRLGFTARNLGSSAAACAPVKADQLYELARRQGGVFARWQALDLGYTGPVIARRLARKEWVNVLGTVLASASTALGPASMEWAAYLACGPNAVLSGPSALSRLGLDVDTRKGNKVWVSIPPERHVTFASVRTIREAVDPSDIVVVDGMRVTSAPRCIVDTLRVVPRHVGQPILDRALLRGWITIEQLMDRAVALAGRRGVGVLRYHLSRVKDGARSEAERRLHQIIADIPGWVADYKVLNAAGELVAVLDVAFPEHELCVEVDGLAFHADPARFQRDRTRQNDLTGLTWRVLRFTWDDLTLRPNDVRRRIVRELAKQDPTPR